MKQHEPGVNAPLTRRCHRSSQSWDYVAYAKALHNGRGKLWTAKVDTEGAGGEHRGWGLGEERVVMWPLSTCVL